MHHVVGVVVDGDALEAHVHGGLDQLLPAHGRVAKSLLELPGPRHKTRHSRGQRTCTGFSFAHVLVFPDGFLLTVMCEVGIAVVHVLVGGCGGSLPCDQSQLRSVCQVDGHDETTTWDSNTTREFFEEETQYNKRIC